MLTHELFLRRHGVRTITQLVNPRFSSVQELTLPRESVLHYLTDDRQTPGPRGDEFIFRKVERIISVDHVTAYGGGELKGLPRVSPTPIDSEIRQYHARFKRYRRCLNVEAALKDKLTPLVVNYGFLSNRYRYVRGLFTQYNQWWNLNQTLWSNINQMVSSTEGREHFVLVELPKFLPKVSELRKAQQAVTQTTLKEFHTSELLFVLELWKWLGKERESSVMSLLSPENAARVNLIFVESGQWTYINLGIINSWRVDGDEPGGVPPVRMQDFLLRYLMAIMEVRTVSSQVSENDPEIEGSLAKVDPTEAESGQEASATGSAIELELAEGEEENDPDLKDGALYQKAEHIRLPPELTSNIERDLLELENLVRSQNQIEDNNLSSIAAGTNTVSLPEDGVTAVVNQLADQGMLSAAEYRRHKDLSLSYKTIRAPNGETLENFIKIPKESLSLAGSDQFADIKTVTDKTMLKTTLKSFDSKYIKEVMDRDIAGMVVGIQAAGISVTEYNVETIEDAVGAYNVYTVRVVPVEGVSSTLRFKLPKLEEDGTFTANGVKSRMRKQRGDLPIRKISPSRVALTSYFGKTFIDRSDKAVNDYGRWICNEVMVRGLNPDDKTIEDLRTSNVFDNLFTAPRLYTILASSFRSFKLNEYYCNFDHTQREQLFGKDILALYERDGSVVVGKTAKGNFLVMDHNDNLFAGDPQGKLVELAPFEVLIQVPSAKAPVDFAEIKVLGKTIPLGIAFSYWLGLDKLLTMLKVTPRRVQAGTRLTLDIDEYPVVFSDETLVFSKNDKVATLILAGFNEYHRILRTLSVYDFDQKGVYLSVLESNKLSARYLRELDLLSRMFIDPITKELLVEMGEPTEFKALCMRATEMLLTDAHPSELDGAWMRIKGNERFAGAVYNEMVRAIRSHNGNPSRARAGVELNPYAVWKRVMQDPSLALVNDINPIQNIRDQEAVTYSGEGGRSTRSMVKNTRIYHNNDMGTISESTVDSGDVGVNVYLSANPKFTSVRGISSRYDISENNPTSLLSSSALLAPGSDRDDPKRVNFVAIQHSHGIACSGYAAPMVRTGYEQVLAQRTGEMFAYAAKQDGVVESVSDTGMIIRYSDGTTKGLPLGRQFGDASGLVIPHELVANLSAGAKFKTGDVLTYNSGYFEKDLLNPKNVVWKVGVMVKVALLEDTGTLEDSSVISRDLANKLNTKVTKVKDIVVDFDQHIHKLVKPGQTLEPEDILCLIEDAVTANAQQFDADSLDTLRVLSQQAPQAKVKGVVERIEVYYHGEKEDMSPTLKAIADAGDRERAARAKAMGRTKFTGSVDDGFRVGKDPLGLDCLCVKVFITSEEGTGSGDKGVFANQMKTVFCKVMEDKPVTESGVQIDAIFGAKSIFDRIVTSPFIIGTTTTLLKVIAAKAVEAYRK